LQPPGPRALPSETGYMSTAGPLARSVGDVRAALRATAGAEGAAAAAWGWTLPPPRHTRLRDFRVGCVLDHPQAPPSNDVATVLHQAIEALGKAGAHVVEGWPDGVDPVAQYASFGFHVQLFFAHQQPGEPFERSAEIISREHERMLFRAAWS